MIKDWIYAHNNISLIFGYISLFGVIWFIFFILENWKGESNKRE